MSETAATTTDYSVLPAMVQRHQRVRRAMGLDANDLTTYRKWRGRVVRKLKQLTGYDTMQRCDLNPRITDSVPCLGYTRQRVEINTEPGVTMPMYVLVPDDLRKGRKRPALICAHGHGSGGKLSPAGVDDDPLIAGQIEHYNYAYGHRMV
ncbi:MAG: alpha/beta hydrolase family protein, partial [Phycisphaeraceae bacterium]